MQKQPSVTGMKYYFNLSGISVEIYSQQLDDFTELAMNNRSMNLEQKQLCLEAFFYLFF